MRIGLILSLLVLQACSKGSECTKNSDCASGYTCLEESCRRLCFLQRDCPGGEVCFEGVCRMSKHGPVPSIESVTGNAASEPERIENGLIVTGSNLDRASFELRQGELGAPLVVRSQEADRAEVLLPASVRQGLHTLAATNLAGETAAEVTLELPDLSAEMLVERINSQETSKLALGVMPPEIIELQRRVAALEGMTIRDSLTLQVGPSRSYRHPSEAWAFLRGKTIADGATVTIKLDDGEYDFEAGKSWLIDHQGGQQLRIEGNAADPRKVTLRFTGADGIVVKNGKALKYLNGVTIVANNGVEKEYSGVLVSNGSVLGGGGAIVARGFSVGFVIQGSSFMYAEGSAERGLMATENKYGYFVDAGSTLLAAYAVASNNTEQGFRVTLDSTLRARYAQAIGSQHGFYAGSRGYMYVLDSNAAGPAGAIGYLANLGSFISAEGTQGTYDPAVNTLDSGGSFIYKP